MPALNSLVFRGLIREQVQMGGLTELALATSIAAANLNSQEANNGAASEFREVYSILRGDTNFRGNAVATNHANVVRLANPQGFRYLELYHIYANALAVTVSTAPVVAVFGKTQAHIETNHLLPHSVDGTNFPADSLPFQSYGLWVPCMKPGYTAGTPQVTMPSGVAIQEHWDADGAAPWASKFCISEPEAVYVGDVSEVIVLIHTAAAFSSTTRSYIGARFSSN